MKTLPLCLTTLLFLTCCGGDVPVQDEPGAIQFEQLQCRTCHGAEGEGTLLGARIADKGEYWDEEKLGRYLSDPKAYAEKDPRLGARAMPALPSDLTAEARAALIAHALGLMEK